MMSLLEFRDVSRSAHLTSCSPLGFRYWSSGLFHLGLRKNVVDCSNIVEVNLRSHKWNGIALSALTVLHVWSILFPLCIDQWKVHVVPGVFEWPLSERTPPGFKDMNPPTEMISMQVDDVFRLVEMILLLCVLLPLSVKWLSTNWHL